MKKHPRMLKLTTKLLVGQSLEFVDRIATDFAEYSKGTSDLHPALLACFKRYESAFGTVFKYRHLIERNHKLRTGIYGGTLLAIIAGLETETGSPKRYYQNYYYQQPKREQEWWFTDPLITPSSKTLH